MKQANLVFDRVLAYELGESSLSEKAEVVSLLKAGNQDYLHSHMRVQEMLGKLPSILAPVAPPPFLKDRVMAQINAPQFGSNLPDHEPIAQPRPIGRFVNAFSIVKRSAVFAGLLVGGIIVSTFTVEKIIDHATPVSRVTLKSMPSTERQFSLSSPMNFANAEQMTQATPVDAPTATLAEQSSSREESQQVHAPSYDLQDGASGHMQTNFGLTQAYVKLKDDPSSQQYKLTPTASNFSGEGRVIWGESYSDALLIVSKLQPTGANGHYVLWYTRDRGLPDRMVEFNAISNTPLSFYVNRAPSARVTGVIVTLERMINGKLESQEVLRSSIKQKVD